MDCSYRCYLVLLCFNAGLEREVLSRSLSCNKCKKWLRLPEYGQNIQMDAWNFLAAMLYHGKLGRIRNSSPEIIVVNELGRIRQLDQHYHRSMNISDTNSIPFKRITKLYHVLERKKSRKHISINKTVVEASKGESGMNDHLVIESDSFGTIKIHNAQNYYLCIGRDGKPVGVPRHKLDSRKFNSKSCVFKEQFSNKHKYVIFKSMQYYKEKTNVGCLAFNKYGGGRKITRARCGHKSTLFMERKAQIIIDMMNLGRVKNKLFSFLKNMANQT